MAEIKKKADEETKKTVFDYMDQVNNPDTMEGFEDITTSTMAIPFLRILQKGSPQLNKMKPEFVPGAEAGHFFNTVTKELYGTKLGIVALKFEHMYIEWLPDRGGFVQYHTPENAMRLAADTTFGHWKAANGNDLTETYAYIVLREEHEAEGIMVLSLAGAAIKVAKEWNRLMTTHIMDNGKKALPYYIVWSMSSEYKENEKGDWYQPKFVYDKYVSMEQVEIARVERKMLPMRTIDYKQIADTTAQDSGNEEVGF